MSLFDYAPHPHIERRKTEAPPLTKDSSKVKLGFNGRLAKAITEGVGTMWCAYIFAIIAIVALPQALHDTFAGGGFHPLPLITWVSQAFLQLVLLSILMVGQQVLGEATDKRSIQTYNDAEAVLHEAQQIQAHLAAQDAELERLSHALAEALSNTKKKTAARKR
ncbi:MAG: hypothetical protein ACYDCC_00695 [Actinomycetota bacterium]